MENNEMINDVIDVMEDRIAVDNGSGLGTGKTVLLIAGLSFVVGGAVMAGKWVVGKFKAKRESRKSDEKTNDENVKSEDVES